MPQQAQEKAECRICHRTKKISELHPAELVRPAVAELIKKAHPDWDGNGYICAEDLNRFRADYIEDIIETDKGELSALEEGVVKSLTEYELLSTNVNVEFDRQLTFGERTADKVADFGGSWRFIFIFTGILVVWIGVNSVYLFLKPFDPYPYILLNLFLSCLAAVQAPIIMMSQNRQEDRDRLRAEQDYRVNLKAELEVRYLHEKLDHLLMRQWQRLMQIQEIQLDIMEELARTRK